MDINFKEENEQLKQKLRACEEMLKQQDTNPLTNLFSRRKFFEEMRKNLAANQDKQFVFMRFDIVRFQLINSFFGLEEGNRLIKYLAFKIKQLSLLFPGSCVGHIEGDVFVVCCQLRGKVEVLISVLEQNIKDFIGGFRSDYELSFAVGIYVIEDNSTPMEDIYSKVILAAKKSKENYGSHVTLYDKKMGEALIKSQRMTNEMRSALNEKQFKVYFQPKCSLETGHIIGAEALVRWQHPQHGLIPPDEFIPVFEKNGFISKVDEYIWDTACAYIRSWMDEGLHIVPVSINVSRCDLRDPALPEKFQTLLKHYGIPPNYVHLEITGSAYVDDLQRILEAVRRLKDIHLHIEMDDFGAAYSSLNMLSEMPIDTLKLDMGFVRNCEHSREKSIILRAVVKLAKELKLSVIAEGIETKEQLKYLHSLGCDYGQGFFFSRPIPEKDFREFVADNIANFPD